MSDRAAPLALRSLLALALAALFAWPAFVVTARALAPIPAAELASINLVRPLTLAWETAKLVGLTALLALPLGTVLAFLLSRTDLPARRALSFVAFLGLFVPLPLLALQWLGAFGNLGRQQALGSGPILVGLFGAAFVHAVAALPWVVLIIGIGLRAVEPELEDAALLVHPSWRVILTVTLRRSASAIAVAALALAVLTAGDMTVTDLIPLRSYAEEAYTLAQQGLDPGRLAVRVTLPQALLLAACLAFAGARLVRTDPERLPLATIPQRVWTLGRLRWPLAILVATFFAALVGLPLYGLIWRAGRVGIAVPPASGQTWSFDGLRGTLARAWLDLFEPDLPWHRTYLIGTLAWSSLGATLTVSLAWPLVWLTRRSTPWRATAIAIVALTLATPGPIVGLALKLAYAPYDWFNRTPALLVAAYVARAFPYAVLFLWPAVRRVPQDWLDTAATCGYPPIVQALRVALPTTRNALIAAWLLAFSIALGELPAAYFVRAPGYDPLSILVWSMLHMGVESRLAGIGLIQLAITSVAALVASLLLLEMTPIRRRE